VLGLWPNSQKINKKIKDLLAGKDVKGKIYYKIYKLINSLFNNKRL